MKTKTCLLLLLLVFTVPCNAQESTDKQFEKGLSYYEGNGVAQDYTEAAKWYRKAAEQGHADATKRLQELLK